MDGALAGGGMGVVTRHQRYHKPQTPHRTITRAPSADLAGLLIARDPFFSPKTWLPLSPTHPPTLFPTSHPPPTPRRPSPTAPRH